MTERKTEADPVVYGDQGPEVQPIYQLPTTEDGKYWILPPPVGPDVVMRYAIAMDADPEISAIFNRLGKWGLPTRAELLVLERFRDTWVSQHGLTGYGVSAYFGANMVFRRIAWGQIESLHSPEAMQFLLDDAPRNVGGPTVGPTFRMYGARLDEVLWYANYVIEWCDFWPLYADDWRNSGIPDRYYAGQVYFDGFSRYYYQPKYLSANKHIIMPCMYALEQIAVGGLKSLSERDAWGAVQESREARISKVVREDLVQS